MLDTPIPPAEGAWPMPTERTQTVTLADAVAFSRQQFWVIAGTVAVLLILATLYVLFTPSTYVGRAELLIEPEKQPALWQANGTIDLTMDSAQVESQVEVLQSERIASDVITRLGLINDPEFRTSGSDYARQRAALAHFENGLSARRVGQSYVIEVSFRSPDPQKAAQITNAVTDAYLRDQQQARQDVADQASQWMESQIADLGVQLNTAAAAAQEFRVSHGITEVSGNNGQPQLIDKLTQLEAKAEAYRKVYEGLLEHFTEDKQQASYPVSNARVITSAAQPLGKSYPKTKLILLLAILIGLVVGIAIAAARVMLDGSVRSAKQLRQALGQQGQRSGRGRRCTALRVQRGAAERQVFGTARQRQPVGMPPWHPVAAARGCKEHCRREPGRAIRGVRQQYAARRRRFPRSAALQAGSSECLDRPCRGVARGRSVRRACR
jgi:uncharacterized protein involved in exopolysaccharide biosynthesis